jgi:hypothetical protein
MSDMQTIADRIEVEALRAELTDAVMMRDFDRLASLFVPRGRNAVAAHRQGVRWPGADPRRSRVGARALGVLRAKRSAGRHPDGR